MIYSAPYLALLSFYGSCAFLFEHIDNPQKKKQITISSIVVFFIFFAFRGYLYTDWISYVEYFDNVEWSNILFFDAKDNDIKEPGFALLAILCKSLINNYFFLVFICISIDTVLFVRFLKRREIENYSLAFMLFITFEGLGIMFNLLRNAIAIFIFINSLEYIEKRKPIQYFLLCLMAISFHFSSFIYLPLYFFLHKRINRWIFISVFFGCFTFYISGASIVLSLIKILGFEDTLGYKVDVYTELYSASKVLSITGTIEKMGLAILVFLYYDQIIENNKGRTIIINSLLAYYFFYYILAEFNTLSYRMSVLFLFSYWVLWGDIIKIFYVKNNRRIAATIVFLYCLYVTMHAINTPCQEYDNILFGAKSYQERLTILNRTYEDDK